MVSSINFCKLSNIFQRSQSRGQRALITRSSPSLPRPVLSARATSKVHFTTHFPNSAHILQFPLWWRLLRRPWGTVPGVPHLRGRWSRRTCQVQLPLPQWNRLQPTILHLRLVVQRRLFTGGQQSPIIWDDWSLRGLLCADSCGWSSVSPSAKTHRRGKYLVHVSGRSWCIICTPRRGKLGRAQGWIFLKSPIPIPASIHDSPN